MFFKTFASILIISEQNCFHNINKYKTKLLIKIVLLKVISAATSNWLYKSFALHNEIEEINVNSLKALSFFFNYRNAFILVWLF